MQVELIEAMLHAGAVVTPYLRAGRGTPLILITQRDRAALQEDPLVQALASHFRVIVPLMPGTAVEGWLDHVIEGLGLQEPRVVIDTLSLEGTAE